LGTSAYYGLNKADTRRIVKQTVAAVAVWRQEAAKLGCSRREIDRMASAFEHEARDAADAFAK
jgi:serine/threonine-protein kinase HipA